MNQHIKLSAPLTAEIDQEKRVVHISSYGDYIINLTHDDIAVLNMVTKRSYISKLSGLFKILLITAFVLIASTASAQTSKLTYHNVSTDHFKQGVLTGRTIKFKSGSINVSQEVITVDTASYTIIKHGKPEITDENMWAQPLLVVTTTKKGGYKVMDCTLLLKPNKTIAEVIFKRTKASTVSYLLD